MFWREVAMREFQELAYKSARSICHCRWTASLEQLTSARIRDSELTLLEKSTKCLRKLGAVNSNLIRVPPAAGVRILRLLTREGHQ